MTSPRSARREVYRIIELRQNILRHLSRADLATFARVTKDSFGETVKELYRDVCYQKVRDYMPGETPRQLQYLAAVREVHECSAVLGPANSYSVRSFNNLVLPILAKCPLLRKATFGPGDGGYCGEDGEILEGDVHDSWVVSFNSLGDGGHIIVDRYIGLSIQSLPPIKIEGPSPPSDRYTAGVRFHLFLSTDPENYIPWLLAEWLAAFRRKPCMTTLYSSIDFEELPVELDDITDLCIQQSQSDHSVRLERISAESVSPWSLYDFENFATAASTSLRHLYLTSSDYKDVPLGAAISAADLPSFISIVRNRLVNLASLSFGMNDMETSEAVCFGMLDGVTLEGEGSIETVYVNAGRSYDDAPAFNLLRVLSALCGTQGSTHVGKNGAWSYQSGYFVSGDFLPCLRSQPLHRRRHLRTVDFATLGLTKLCQVRDLEYDEEGRPLPLSRIAEVQEL